MRWNAILLFQSLLWLWRCWSPHFELAYLFLVLEEGPLDAARHKKASQLQGLSHAHNTDIVSLISINIILRRS